MKKGRDVMDLVNELVPGDLVTIEWVGDRGFDRNDPGQELEAPEVAIVLRRMAEQCFYSIEGICVMPFECLHRGAIRSSTTYACKRLGRQ